MTSSRSNVLLSLNTGIVTVTAFALVLSAAGGVAKTALAALRLGCLAANFYENVFKGRSTRVCSKCI